MIDLARQERDASMGYALEPELTSWPTSCPQDGGWIDLPTGEGERTELLDPTEEVARHPVEGLRNVAPDDWWFYGAYRRYHAGIEPSAAPGRAPVPRRRLPTSEDREIRRAVQRALQADPDISGRVQVRCRGGEVTIGGTAPDEATRRRAESLVGAVGGVIEVRNRMRIVDRSRPSPRVGS